MRQVKNRVMHDLSFHKDNPDYYPQCLVVCTDNLYDSSVKHWTSNEGKVDSVLNSKVDGPGYRFIRNRRMTDSLPWLRPQTRQRLDNNYNKKKRLTAGRMQNNDTAWKEGRCPFIHGK